MSVTLIGKNRKGDNYFYDDKSECFYVVPYKFEFEKHDTLLPTASVILGFLPLAVCLLALMTQSASLIFCVYVAGNIVLIMLYLFIGHKSTAAEMNKLKHCPSPQVIDLKTADSWVLRDLLVYANGAYPFWVDRCFSVPLFTIIVTIYLAISSDPDTIIVFLFTIPHLAYGVFMWCSLHMSKRLKVKRKVKELYRASQEHDDKSRTVSQEADIVATAVKPTTHGSRRKHEKGGQHLQQ